jgi:ABC-type dipeptide/oligopeptide/nickel transport system ATPase subunit
VDFYQLRAKRTKEGTLIYPDFVVQNSKDLLVKGRAFYAVWDESRGLWSRDEMDVARMVDADLYRAADESDGVPLLMSSYESKSWTSWKNYVSSLDDSDVDLDLTLSFADDLPDRKKYASRRLPYSLTEGPCPAWDELVGTLYLPAEREKIEWMIGSIMAGDSKKNQKFFVFYGQSGSGKSTVLGIMEKLFEGYYIPIDMKALGQANNNFAMAGFKSNPLLAIQHDGDLSRIEDNTKLNSLVSHELMPINEKFRSEYYTRILALLALGTNEPVKITGSKSGIIRRLIDIHPSGNLIPNKHYHALLNQIEFELGAIANHCLGVYFALGKNYYSNYKPTLMMYETDVFYNYVEHSYDLFFTQDGVSLDRAWQLYKEFCEDALVRHKMARHQFRSELQNYFETFEERATVDGQRVRNYFSGFKTHRFLKVDDTKPLALVLDEEKSILDDILAEQPAQYATTAGTPKQKWEDVKTTLSNLDTNQLHYVKVPENHIVIDFDLKDENGNKSLERNLEAAAEWPVTYAELSQSGEGIHLHYGYAGPGGVADLSPTYSDGIEVKTLTGNSSLRRRLSRCNNIAIAKITSGLPLKEKPVHDAKAMASEKTVREMVIKNLHKGFHPGTKPSVEFIKKILEDAYDSGIPYDVSDLYPDVWAFAMDSTHHARHCMQLVQDMPFMSEDMELKPNADDNRIAFFDVEVFPNLLVICWKFAGDASVVKMMNPSPQECEELMKLKLVGFNCRRYDNHIVYARAVGMSIEQIYDISQRIVVHNDRSAMFGGAYDISYTDIYDFSSKKQSLKKFEIELGIHHMELGLPWEEPVAEELWDLVADYCANDVVATEATFEARKADFIAREILAELSGLSVNHSTQQHTARIIFGKEKRPQKEFIYTDLSEMFPGYEYDFGKSTYRGELVGEGGYVYAEPGHYRNVALLDVASMHPSSIELLNAFGSYTEKFSELKAARIAIKRGDIFEAKSMMDGKLAPYLEDEDQAEALAYALKIVINIVYGLTSAKFENPFRDPRNKDNIVAKRGALFMIDLKQAVQDQGFTVAHIKTDSIKIPDATPEIIDFVFKFGEKYGYEFEHEATYDEFVLFNDAVYIAKYGADHPKKPGHWEAVGAQFQHPYVYKTLLSGEEITFDDLCETRNVVKGEIFIVTADERRFVGRIGLFVPVIAGSGGGALLRVSEGKDYAVTGTKGYEWVEAETVKQLGLEDKIDYEFFNALVAKAKKALEDVGYPL